MGVRVGVETFFLGQLIGIDETNAFQLKFFIGRFVGVRVGVRVGVENFFLGQSIGIIKNNSFQLKFLL